MNKTEIEELIRYTAELYQGFSLNDSEKRIWTDALENKEYKNVKNSLDLYYRQSSHKPRINDILPKSSIAYRSLASKKEILERQKKVVVWDKENHEKGLALYFSEKKNTVGIKWIKKGQVVTRFIFKDFLVSELLTEEEIKNLPNPLEEAKKRFKNNRENYIELWKWASEKTRAEILEEKENNNFTPVPTFSPSAFDNDEDFF